MSAPPILPPLMDWLEKVLTAENQAYDSRYKQIMDKTNDPREATKAAVGAAVQAGTQALTTTTVVGAGMAVADALLSAFFAALSAFRKQTTHSFDATTAEVVNEFLGTSLDASIMSTGAGGDETIQKANAIGGAIFARLEKEFTGGGAVTPESGAAAARTFAGYGVNFGIQNAIVSLLGACVPEVHLDDLRELGVEVAGNLGLGALISSAIAPLVNATIVKPYTRQLATKYQQDLLGPAELARAVIVDRMPGDTAMNLLRQWGYSEDQNTEFIEQMRLRLRSNDWNVLVALGQTPSDEMALEDRARGMTEDLVTARQLAETYHRLQRPRMRALQVVLSEISKGFLQVSDLQGIMGRLNVPADEQQIWIEAAQTFTEVPRKRMSEANMLFLYEAAQITEADVYQWAKDEGYSPTDAERLSMFFQLKAAEASMKTTGGSAAKAARLHIEHTAYVTDEITGLWGRPPTAAELTYWVNLLDLSERTKHDFVTEIKGLPATGSAIPPA